jgi:putative phosphoesterase
MGNMTTRIGLLSDVHATPAPVAEALSVFKAASVDGIFCAGDIAGYGDALDETVDLLIGCDCRAIRGNHESRYLERMADKPDSRITRFFNRLPPVVEFTIAGKSLYMVHASPPLSDTEGIRLLDEHGDVIADEKQQWSQRLAGFEADVLVVGHTHQVFAEWLGTTLVINPGSTKFNHSCGILSLPDLAFRVIPLSGKTPVRAWHWGTELRKQELTK